MRRLIITLGLGLLAWGAAAQTAAPAPAAGAGQFAAMGDSCVDRWIYRADSGTVSGTAGLQPIPATAALLRTPSFKNGCRPLSSG